MGEADWGTVLTRIREELSTLACFVDKTKQGIDSVESTVRIGTEKFPEASTQLSAVTGDLENAANNIMSIIEVLMEENERECAVLKDLKAWAESLPEGSGEKGLTAIAELSELNTGAKASMMDVFASLSFHDLSGQKLKKIITSLSMVQNKLIDLANKFGVKFEEGGTGAAKGQEPLPIDQDMVDKLLKELSA